MTREEWKARYRAMRMIRSMRQAERRRARVQTTPHQGLPHLIRMRTERAPPRRRAGRRKVNAAVSSVLMLVMLALLSVALLSGADPDMSTPQPVLVSQPLARAPMEATSPI